MTIKETTNETDLDNLLDYFQSSGAANIFLAIL